MGKRSIRKSKRSKSIRSRQRKSSKRQRKSSKRQSFFKRFFRMRKNKFGGPNMPNTARMMGNYRPDNMMNTFQQYTGMGREQYNNHIGGISRDLRSNFYKNVQ